MGEKFIGALFYGICSFLLYDMSRNTIVVNYCHFHTRQSLSNLSLTMLILEDFYYLSDNLTLGEWPQKPRPGDFWTSTRIYMLVCLRAGPVLDKVSVVLLCVHDS